MNLPSWMITCSFRYCLGRMTHAVNDFVEWALINWDDIPPDDKKIIEKELREAIKTEIELNKINKRKPKAIQTTNWSPLGMEQDKKEWQRLYNHINQHKGSKDHEKKCLCKMRKKI